MKKNDFLGSPIIKRMTQRDRIPRDLCRLRPEVIEYAFSRLADASQRVQKIDEVTRF